MPYLKIKICRANETEPAFPFVKAENFAGELELVGLSILERGMTSGKTAIGLLLHSGGAYFMAQTSAEILRSAAAALEGAEINWKENPL